MNDMKTAINAGYELDDIAARLTILFHELETMHDSLHREVRAIYDESIYKDGDFSESHIGWMITAIDFRLADIPAIAQEVTAQADRLETIAQNATAAPQRAADGSQG